MKYNFIWSDISSATSASTSTFTTALWLNAAVFALEILAFTILYKRFRSIYEPRTFLTPENKRSKPLPSFLKWPWAILKADYRDIRTSNGMDAFFFVRFLRMMVKIFVPIWALSWAILLPVDSVKLGAPSKDGLDQFTFGNITTNQQARYAAHLILAWLFTIWIWYNIKREMANFVITRQQYLVDPTFSSTPQANTVLVTGVPPRYLSERAINEVFSHAPGGVKKVWINRDLGELPDLYDRRVKALNKLESAETKILKLATKAHSKQLKATAKAESKTKSNSEASPADLESQAPVTSLDALVPEKKRPSHKIPKGKIPFGFLCLGNKVNTIEWAREEIATTTAELEKGRKILREEEAYTRDHAAGKLLGKLGGVVGLVQRVPGVKKPRADGHTSPDGTDKNKLSRVSTRTSENGTSGEADAAQGVTSSGGETGGETEGSFVERSSLTYPPLNSAFVLFHNQAGAHMAAQVLVHHEPYRMYEREIGVAPADIIWGNLGLNPYERKMRQVIGLAATVGLIIGWAFPVAFVGAVSNVASLCETYSWLQWICTLPDIVLGIIQGILPPVLLALLMMLLPIILRLLAKFEGVPRRSGVELRLMSRYFLFQVIHSFLIVTLASGIIAALPELLDDPGSIPTILAQKLPSASNFFLTYVILQGLSGSAAGFLQAIPLVIYYAKLFILGSTPRSVYNIKYTLRNVKWGTLFPATTLIVVISITYSVISPIINGLACVTFFLFYQLYKYLFLYQFDQPAEHDTGGLFFPKAIQHVFTGLYLQQICLTALFFLARDASGDPSAIPQGALMIVLIVLTVLFHLMINNSYGPLLYYLPLSLADKAHANGGAEANAGLGPGSRPARSHSDLTDGEKNVSSSPVAGKSSLDITSGRASGSGSDIEKAANERTALMRRSNAEENDVKDFYHPATVVPQRIVWIPADALGLSEGEVRACGESGVDASSVNARMDEKGRVHVDGPPPDGESAVV
ncbi:PHM7_2 [Sanghuangporus sanghuang]